ncbi:MAG: energy-coupling factor ABC transporter permease [Gammaproteobacteria bacterium]|nr:energy-coupling factor ABC transporter permease [Gammaproteobacteria bacterium]MBU1777209.1 energy-coupling factor ABC transporter permease [Gammaproteobacteria bacterium]MBU1969188.1 energy-coupling factor ABC transporter permease [Gammaproteobacteria bacterium]
MNLPASLFSVDWLWLTNALFAFFLYRATVGMPWRKVLDNGIMVNALVGLLLGAIVFWHFNVGIRPGLNFHILGATLFMLMFGWQVATLSLTLVMTGTWIYSGIDLLTLGVNGLLMIAIPVLFSDWLLRFSKNNLPKNLFLFVLFNGFVCGALSIFLNAVATTLILVFLSPYTWGEIQHHYLVAIPILMLTEAFVTGMMITAFTVFQPDAVMNFSDEEYINGK